MCRRHYYEANQGPHRSIPFGQGGNVMEDIIGVISLPELPLHQTNGEAGVTSLEREITSVLSLVFKGCVLLVGMVV